MNNDVFQISNQNVLISKYLLIRTLIQLATGLSVNFIAIYYLNILNPSEYGFLLSVIFLSTAILEYPSGIITDIIGEKCVLIISHVIFTTCWFSYIFIQTPFELFIVELFCSFGSALYSGTLASWLVNSFQKEDPELSNYKRSIGKINSIFLIISSFIAISGGIIADLYTFKYIFLLEAFFSIICIIFFLILLKPIQKNDSSNNKEIGLNLIEFRKGLSDFTQNTNIIKATFSYIFIFTAYSLFFNIFWQPITKSSGASYAVMGLTGGIGVIVMALANWISTSYYKIEDKLFILTLLYILPFVSIWITATMSMLYINCVLLIFYQCLVGLTFPHYDFYFHKNVQNDSRARMIGIKNVLLTMNLSFSFSFTGLIQQTFGIKNSIILPIIFVLISSYLLKNKGCVK